MAWFLKKLAATILISAPLSVMAGTFGAHIGSHHTSGNWCNFNPGVYIVSASGWTAGTYKNSECTQSFYSGKTFNQYGKLSVTVGLVSGYRRATVLPVVYPSAKVASFLGTDFRIGYIPKIGGDSSHVFHLSIERGW